MANPMDLYCDDDSSLKERLQRAEAVSWEHVRPVRPVWAEIRDTQENMEPGMHEGAYM